MFINKKTKTSKMVALILAVVMIIGMIPVSLWTVFAETTANPGAVTITVVDDVTGEPIEGAKVTYVIYDNDLGEDVMGDDEVSTDANGKIVVFEGAELGNIKIRSIVVTHNDYVTYTNEEYDQAITSLQDNFTIEMTCPEIKGVTVTANDLTYNGEAQKAVTIEGLLEDDTVTYTIDGKSSADGMVTDAKTYAVVVKVERENFNALEVPVEVTVKKGVLDFDIAAIPNLKYDGTEQVLVTLAGAFAEGDTVIWTVDNVDTEKTEIPTAMPIGNYKVKLTVVRNDNYETFEKEVDVSINTGVLNIKDLEIKANNRVYDGIAQDALIVTNQGDYNIEYSFDGENDWKANEIPQITEAGTYTVYVRAAKTYYETVEYPTYPINVTIAQAEITGVEIKGYSGIYDSLTHNAIEVVGEATGDIVTYATEENGAYTDVVPSVKNVKDSGTYYVKVVRNDNYETLTIPVEVAISKAEQVLSFEDVADRLYNEENTFTYEAVTDAEDAEGKITYEKVGGTADFEVTEDGVVTYTSVGTIKVKAKIAACDNYLADEEVYEIQVAYIDVPEWTITDEIVRMDDCNWYNGNVEIKAENWEIVKGSNALGQTGWQTSIIESGENDYPNYKVAFKDEDGNITDLVDIPYFAIDKTAPTKVNVIDVKFDKATALEKVINFLSFGLFCNTEIEVTVKCDDMAEVEGAPYSDVATIELFAYTVGATTGTPVAPKEGTTNVFTLPMNFEGSVKVKVTDKVGNTLGEQLISGVNSNMDKSDTEDVAENESGYIMTDDDAPVVFNLMDEGLENVRNQENTNNYSGDIKISFKAQDTGAGLSSVKLTVNKEDRTDLITSVETPTAFAKQDRNEYAYSFTTENIEPDENGKYEIVTTVVDNAGNETVKSLTVEKDLTAPVITGFDFTVGNSGVDVEDCVTVEDYGYYFKEGVTIKVSAADQKAEGAHELISGVKEITVVLVDKDGNYYTVETDGKISRIANGAQDAITHTATENAFVFEMTEDFKGQIYAFATDNVGNNPATASNKFDLTPDDVISDSKSDLLGYKHPAGSILESQEKHDGAEYDHITFEKTDAKLKTNDEESNELYTDNVSVVLVVTDKYSGIGKVEWSVEAPYDTEQNQGEVIEIENNCDTIDGWEVTEKDVNLITQLKKEIEVTNNSNNIVVWVKLTDRAGNTTEDSIQFNIDKTAPIVTIEMNDNDDADNAGFFNVDRKFTATILERNFINDGVKFDVTVTDETGKTSVVPIAPAFELAKENGKPVSKVIEGIEYYTYTWTHTFQADGDYQFAVSAKDLAEWTTVDEQVSYVSGNTDIRAISNTFTIDQTAPVISVSYNNNSALNGKYFAAPRTATIVVTEHNFEASRVIFTRNGSQTTIPAGSWRQNGDVYTATIPYNQDGNYTFDVTAQDKAGNNSPAANYGSSIAPKDFVVDQTIEKPVIEGVENGCAYKETVIPSISFGDVNFDTYEVKLLRTRMGEKNVDVTDQFITDIKETAQGGSGTFDTFEKIVENDGIYTLTVKIVDKAGNEATEECTFSVNRFGSVYEYSDELIALIKDGGQYVQSVDTDLVITEYNADKILEGSLKILITRDGESVDVDFTSNPEANAEVTIGESGWYQYVYTIKASNFETDGVYKISLASEYSTTDSEKNESSSVPENSIDKQGAQILDTMNFTVDSVAPEIRNIVNLDKKIADKDKIVDGKLNVKYTIVDVGGLKTIEIIVNGVTIQTLTAEDIAENAYNFTGSFDLSEQDGTNAHKVQIRVTDLAGNVTDTNSEEFRNAHSEDNEDSTYLFFSEVTVSRNFFVRWYANTGLFWGSIGGVVVVAAAVCVIAAKKKKKEEA